MDKLKCCRICLIMDVKMCHISSNNLKQYYDLMLHESGPKMLPSYVCYECTSFLYKCNLFREKCKRGQSVLQNIAMITSEEIKKIDREGNNLKSTLQYVQLYNITNIDNNKAKEDNDVDFFSSKTNPTEKIVVNINNVINTEEYFDSESIPNEDDNLDIENSDKNGNPHKTASTKLKHNKNKNTRSKIPNKCHNSGDIPPNNCLEKVNSNANKTKSLHKSKSNKIKNPRKKPNTGDISLKDNVLEKLNKDNKSPNVLNNNYNKHIFDKDKWKIVILNEEAACREFNQREQIYRDSPYRCDLCLKGFSTFDIMNRHLPIHSEERGPHVCDICKRRFRWKTKLNYHKNEHLVRYHCLKCTKIFNKVSVALIHEKCHDGKKYACSLCNAEFRNKSTYYSHVRLKHRSEFVCEMCGDSFVSRIGVNQHRKRIHSIDSKKKSEESSRCEKCDKTFMNTSAYVKHISNSSIHCDDIEVDKEIKTSLFKMSNLSNTETTTCDQCGDTFKSALSCLKHIRRIHTEGKRREQMVCEICGVYVLKTNARNHRNSHTRAVQFPCTTCGRIFNSAANRYRHMVLHTGQKPYSCKVCSKSYTQRNNLQVHYKTHHLKLPSSYRTRHREPSSDRVP